MSGGTTRHARRELTLWLLRVARPLLPPLGWAVLMRVAGLVAGAALLGIAIDGVLNIGAGGARLAPLLGSLVAVALAKALARYLEQYAGHYVAFRALALLRVRLFESLEPQAPAAVEGRRTGDLLSRATRDVDRVEVFFAHTVGPALTAVVVPLGVAGWLAWFAGPAAAGAALVGWSAMVAVSGLGARASVAASIRLRTLRGDLAQHLTDSIQGMAEVVGFGAQPRRVAELDAMGVSVSAAQRVRGRWAAARRGLVQALVIATPLAVMVSATPGAGWQSALVAAGVVLGTSPAVIAVEEFAAELDQAYAAAARLREVIEARPATPEPTVPASAPRASSLDVELDAVTFSYPSAGAASRPVLRDVSLTLPAGTVTGLVGVSGAGKSTVGALIARFHDPDSGTVSVGGVDLRALADSDLRSLVTVIPQRPYLFRGTIRDNLRIAAPEADDGALLAACQSAALGDTLARMPDGLDTIVGEHGTSVSGGERQRIAIARALLRDTPVLVFDEVTSDLDAATEARLMSALRAASAGRTVVLIAHRLATVRDADQIVVMDGGAVLERGTHASLLARDGGAYARLWARQDAAVARIAAG